MITKHESAHVNATVLALALTEFFPESAYGAVPASDYATALEAYRAYADGVFDEAPLALLAYVRHQREMHA
jgi:hypothetical protein